MELKKLFGFVTANGTVYKLNGLALGGSVGTNGILRGELIVFDSLDELKNASEEDVGQNCFCEPDRTKSIFKHLRLMVDVIRLEEMEPEGAKRSSQ